jgi:flagella basal body P-ring formation protein FlgA
MIAFLQFPPLLCLAAALSVRAEPDVRLLLRPAAQVRSDGIYISQIAGYSGPDSAPHVRIADAPAFGKASNLTRAQVQAALLRVAPDFEQALWAGADRIQITRCARPLGELELMEMLTTTLQRDHIKDTGELELRLGRTWTAIPVPDEALIMRILELPATGLSPNCILRFELRTASEMVGNWQVTVKAKLWREIAVARTALKRGDVLTRDDLVTERRDALALRNLFQNPFEQPGALELVQNLSAGSPLFLQSVRIKPVIQRGQIVEALIQDGLLAISVRVQVLEDGSPGQSVRVRNLQSKRELRGKVQDEQTILIPL